VELLDPPPPPVPLTAINEHITNEPSIEITLKKRPSALIIKSFILTFVVVFILF